MFLRSSLFPRVVGPLVLLLLCALSLPAPAQYQFRRGDVNTDGLIDIADPVLALAALFSGGSIPCGSAADANDDGAIDIGDPIALLAHLFSGGAPPPAPFPACGGDPTPDALDCAASATCPPDLAPGQPFLLDASPALVRAGDIVTLTGWNFSADPGRNRVEFSAAADGGTLAGAIEGVTIGAPVPGTGIPASLVVRVPTGVRTGAVLLEVELADGSDLSGGSAPITAVPVLTGYAIGDDGRGGAVLRDAFLSIYPDTVQLFGHNLAGVTSVSIDDGIQTSVAPSIALGLHPTATYALPAGLEALTVELPAGLLPDGCTTSKLEFVAHAAFPGGPVHSTSPLEIPFAFIDIATGAISEIPVHASGKLSPQGVRTGELDFEVVLFHEPGGARWDLEVEYQDPADPSGATFLPCTLLPPSVTSSTVIGTVLQPSPNSAVIGPGTTHRFTWDTAADLPPAGGTMITALRVRPVDPVPTGGSPSAACAAVVLGDRLVIDDDFPALGSIREEFADDDQADPATTALWDEGGSGILTAPQSAGAATWGTGIDDLILSAGSSYVIDTDAATIIDVTVPANPIDLLPAQPGAPAGEIHLRSLQIELGAAVQVIGENALVIRCSGDGNDAFLAAAIHGTLDLDGATALAATDSLQGFGGAGGPGGGDGGDGGWLAVDINDQLVTAFVPATRGGLGGGGAGTGVSFVGFGSFTVWLPKAGPGGGGGHAAHGEPGINTYNPLTNPRAGVGEGGLPHGDSALTRIRGGSGGGGGGGTPVRLTTTTSLAPKHGGGGGGGGGAFALIARGTVSVTGSITCDGGNGSKGSSGNQPGSGGGGAGGAILLRATGDIGLGGAAVLSALGGLGAVTQSSTGVAHRGGNGSDGRIRLEANGSVKSPGTIDPGGIFPPLGSPGITSGLAGGVIETGSGTDGPLDASLLGSTGAYRVDTALGRIIADGGAVVLQNASGTGLFELTSLDLPAGVTLTADGPNPLILLVTGRADVRGTIDIAGADGDIPDHSVPLAPLPGAGGSAGAGGGAGGDGGFAAGITAGDGEIGGLPPTMPIGYIVGPPPGGGTPVPIELVTPAIPGSLWIGPGCAAGSGGGGGYGADGEAGIDVAGCPDSGVGGNDYGSIYFLVPDPNDPFQSIDLPVGGGGGAGGGGAFVGFGVRSPGSGGGGAGGFLRITSGEDLTIHGSAAIHARGGDSYLPAEGGGGGGGGAGGAIHLRGANRVDVDSGAILDVRGGLAGLDPVTAGLSPDYVPAAISTAGDGASGRIRIESPLGFAGVTGTEVIPPATIGEFLTAGLAETEAVSLPYRVVTATGLVPGSATFLPLEVELASPLPAGAHAIALLEGAHSDPAAPGRPGEFFGLVDEPALLDGVEWIRMRIFLYSSGTGAPEIERIELPFE